jgi:hypothetical protein
MMMLTAFPPQEKKYRSMQEHIRRAHPEHYIPKLPATEESFALMVNTQPSERPAAAQQSSISPANMPAGPVGVYIATPLHWLFPPKG